MSSTSRSAWWTIAVIGASLALSTPPARAQRPPDRRPVAPFISDTSHTADALLRNAAAHTRSGQWNEAIDIYQRIVQQHGEKVAELPRDDPAADPTGQTTLSVELQLYCQRKLLTLPPEGRAAYRAKVDDQAGRWFKQGKAARDRTLLRKVVDQAFASSWGDDAAEVLGDLAFQEGRFAEAIAHYRRVVPAPGSGEWGMVYPDPDIDVARVAAKILLGRSALGDDPPAPADLQKFDADYPGSTGAFAGRSGAVAASLADAIRSDNLRPAMELEARWPTFAGSASRSRIAPGPIDVGSFQWKVELEPAQVGRPIGYRGMNLPNGGASPVPAERLLTYHPIVLGDRVIVCNDRQVLAFNLNDRPEDAPRSLSPVGAVPLAWKQEPGSPLIAPATRFTTSVPRFTLSSSGGRIFARLGQSQPSLGRNSTLSSSYLVAIDSKADGKLLWRKLASELPLPGKGGDRPARSGAFEGAPVADAGSVYIALTEVGPMTQIYVACLDAETGSTRWVRYVGAATGLDPIANNNMVMMPNPGFGGSVGQRLLTLDGPTIYYQTNLGALAALDAETGGIRWVANYPRRERDQAGRGPHRDLNPAIVHGGLAIVAPDDASSIFAFDAATGRLAWKSEPIPDDRKLAHLLGVAKGRLIATGDRVFWFDIKDGKLVHAWPDGGQVADGFGRGILAGGSVYWPTQNEIHVLDQATGLRVEPPIKLQESFQTKGGNLAAGDGYLIVAQADSLVVFCQNSRLIQRYRDEIAKFPGAAAPHYRLARAAEATDQDDLALSSFDRAAELARPSELIDGVPLIGSARSQQHRLWMKLGRRDVGARRWVEAVARFEGAGRVAQGARERLSARLELASAREGQGEFAGAVDALQGLLADDSVRSLDQAEDGSQRTVRADLLIAERLHSLLDRRGRSFYAIYEGQARELLERGRSARDPRILEDVARSFPTAGAVAEAWLAIGELADATGRPAEAARAYRRYLGSAATDAEKARALWGLALAYEAQRLWTPARATYSQLLSRFPDQTLGAAAATEGESRAGALATARLRSEPFDRMAGDRSEPNLAAPIVRRWGRRWSGPARTLAASGIAPSGDSGQAFQTRGSVLRPVDPDGGETGWSADLDGEPTWVGYLADRAVAATPRRLYGLALDSGETIWRQEFEGSAPAAELQPFEPAGRPAGEVAPLHDFRVIGVRVYCLRGESTLIAVDGETGQVDWSYTPASAKINAHYWIDAARIVIQTRSPDASAIEVLDTESGRRVASFARSRDEDWLRDPLPLDDDRVALVVDRRTIVLFDLVRGADAWTFRETTELPRNGPPRLFSGGDRLLMLHEGNELIRLDPASGKKLWGVPLGIEDLSERPGALALDGDRFYCATGRMLVAIGLGDGSRAWSSWQAGPESGWSITLTDTCVLAYPQTASSDEARGGRLPLVLRRRDTGRLVQRLVFDTDASRLDLILAPRGAIVASEEGLWSLAGRRTVDGETTPR